MEKDFLDAFSKSLNNSSNDSLDGYDYSRLFAFDQNIRAEDILENPTLNNIPVFNWLLSAADTTIKLNNWNLLNQTAAFFQEFYKGELSGKAKKHLEQILSNQDDVQNELGRILILLNKNIDQIKSKYDAKYLLAYLNYHISSDEFFELLDITDRMFISDFDLLHEAYKSKGVKNDDLAYKHDRLISFGLLMSPYDHRGVMFRSKDDPVLEITPIGERMCKIIFESMDT